MRLAAKRGGDALAVDFSAGMIPHIGALPCPGMSLLSDKGLVASGEGDAGVPAPGFGRDPVTGP